MSTPGTLRSQNHLQQAAGIIEQILKFFAGGAQNFCSQVGGGFYSRDRGIFGDVTNLVHLDAGFSRKGGLQLIRKGSWFCIAAGKGADEAGELRLSQRGRKVNAGNTGSDQQLRKTFFAAGCSERHAIEQDLIAGSAEQKARTSAFVQRAAQFLPRSFKLGGGAHMPELIKAGELQQNVEAANKAARATARVDAHVLWRGTAPPEFYSSVSGGNKTRTAADAVAI
jgi:hypothetical protein